MIANKWFSDKERALVTSILGLCIPIGSIVSFSMAGFIFAGADPLTYPQGTKNDLYHLLAYQNYWITVITIPFVFIIRDKPAYPPSLVATKDPEERNFCAALSEVLKIRSYVLLLIIFCMVDGAFISMSDIISQLFTDYHYSTGDTSMFGGVTVVFGVMASMCVGIMLQKTSRYLITIRCVCIGTISSFVLAAIVLPMGNFWGTCFTVALLGTCIVPVIPASMGLGAELTFPMAPALTNGILLMTGQLGGAVFGILAEFLCGKGPFYALGLFMSMVLVASIMSIFVVEDLRRTNFAKIKSTTEINHRNSLLSKFDNITEETAA